MTALTEHIKLKSLLTHWFCLLKTPIIDSFHLLKANTSINNVKQNYKKLLFLFMKQSINIYNQYVICC